MNSYSQAGQDIFAAYVNRFKKNGYYVDLGANRPFLCNNTAVLERELSWKGILVDYSQDLIQMCQAHRPNNVSLCVDLETKSVEEILAENGAPETIDYLSFDIDGDAPRKACLKSIDFSKRKINAITFEHDAYLVGPEIKLASRKILEANGMYRLCSNVLFGGCDFEDWYVSNELINGPDRERLLKLQSTNKEYTDIIKLCQ